MKETACAIYTRTAAASASRIEEQRQTAEAYIAAEGMTVLPERYDDDGQSGNTADRPGLFRLKRDVARGMVDRVVVERFDRLARSAPVFAECLDFFQRHGVDLIPVARSFATATSGIGGKEGGA